MKRPLLRLLLVGLLLVGLAGLGAGLWLGSFLGRSVAPAAPQVVLVKPGSAFGQVARTLEQRGVIADSRRFVLLARWQEVTARIQAGEYLFEEAARPAEVLQRLVAGDVRKLQVTIPEGFNLKEIAARVERADIATAAEFLALASDPDQARRLGIGADTLEGYLFPETYTVNVGASAQELIEAMVTEFEDRLTPELLAAAAQQNLNRHQLVTLASIIQKEAGNLDEMPLIAAVFHNRLQRRIPLQADPTVIYGIADFDGNLTRKHLETPTPYNTYRRRGLPPGPIASPGIEALQAAAHPADVNYLYFVARGDGTHVFNATLREHNRDVRRYQLRR